MKHFFISAVQLPDQTEQLECGSEAVAITLGVMFGLSVIVAIILGVLAWRYWRKYKNVGGQKAEPYVKTGTHYRIYFT